MSELPEFKNDDEAAAWFDTHDTADLMDSMEEVTDPFEIVRTLFPTKPLDVRLRADYLEAIQELAERKGVPYQMLIQNWLIERMNEEAPDLLTV